MKRTIKHFGFTLAEVLITLSIIGVVAAMTIPVLNGAYNKHIVITRMQKFYSNFNQALQMSEIENGNMNGWTLGTLYNYSSNKDFYDNYLQKYIRVINTEDRIEALPIHGIKLYFLDGSSATIDNEYIVYAPVASKTQIYGKDLFVFRLNINYATSISACHLRMNPYGCNYADRATMKANCADNATTGRACAALIIYDGWKIANDYPVNF